MLEKRPVQPPLSPPGGEVSLRFAKSNNSEKQGVSFQKILTGLIDKVNQLEKNADESIQKLITGEIESIHQVMVAAEEANLAFHLMMEIRNKLVEAYKEIMRMQI